MKPANFKTNDKMHFADSVNPISDLFFITVKILHVVHMKQNLIYKIYFQPIRNIELYISKKHFLIHKLINETILSVNLA